MNEREAEEGFLFVVSAYTRAAARKPDEGEMQNISSPTLPSELSF